MLSHVYFGYDWNALMAVRTGYASTVLLSFADHISLHMVSHEIQVVEKVLMWITVEHASDACCKHAGFGPSGTGKDEEWAVPAQGVDLLQDGPLCEHAHCLAFFCVRQQC